MRHVLLVLALAAAPMIAGPGTAPAQTGHAGHGAMADAVHAEATINSIDGDTVNLSHGPIAQIGWPAMTMDLRLLEGAEVGAVAAGDKAMMMLEKGPDGMYGIRALMPAD